MKYRFCTGIVLRASTHIALQIHYAFTVYAEDSTVVAAVVNAE